MGFFHKFSVGAALVGQPVAFSFTWRFDEGRLDRAAGYTYALDFDNDGTFDVVGRAAKQTHTFATSGTYPVRAKIFDKDGGAQEFRIAVTVVDPLAL